MHVSRPYLRASRAAVFAATCVLVSAALHVMAGGAPVRPVVLAAALPATWLGAFLLADRQRGMDVLLGSCFAAQYGMHLLFTAGAEPVTSSPGAHEHGTGTGLGMLLIHAATALLSAWLLERGETALAMIVHLAVTPVRAVRAVLRVLVAGPADITPAVHGLVSDSPVPVPRRYDFAVVVARRGPPPPVSVL